jgi:hypothetical protein
MSEPAGWTRPIESRRTIKRYVRFDPLKDYRADTGRAHKRLWQFAASFRRWQNRKILIKVFGLTPEQLKPGAI